MSDLNRFLEAQENFYDEVIQELTNGHKQSHWMWFVFPQLKRLGTSERSIFYGIFDLNEAIEFLKHSILGQRLRECVSIILKKHSSDAVDIFGTIDSKKLQSCLTLFEIASTEDADIALFGKALVKYFDGQRDPKTIQILKKK